MAKDPAFLFYTADFLTGTMFMSNEQVGIYIRLLCAQHQHGGAIDKNSFNSLVGDNDAIRAKFSECEDGFYNQRLLDEMGKRLKKSKSLSENAKKRWMQKQCKSNAIASDLHMPIEDEDEDENVNKDRNRIKSNNKILNEFLDYRREIGKTVKSKKSVDAMLDKLIALSGGNEGKMKEIVNQSISNGWQGLFELKETKKTRYGRNDFEEVETISEEEARKRGIRV